jgi:hypothetical protein
MDSVFKITFNAFFSKLVKELVKNNLQSIREAIPL